MDTFSPTKRSEIMSHIGGKNTAPELGVRRLLCALGYRYRLHRADLPGNPDIVFPSLRKAILVHGCFWHGHVRCRRSAQPASNGAFWAKKLAGNVARDHRVIRQLRHRGWKILVVWQCQLADLDRLRARLVKFLSSAPEIA
jgi:DNA mismatch endonuclease (patch repair protein)